MSTPEVSDAAYAAAAEGEQRDPTWSLTADWDRDGQFSHPLSDLTSLVEEFTVSRQIGGDLPATVGLVEGYVTASLTATLSQTWDEHVVDELPDPLRNLCPAPAPRDSAPDWRLEGATRAPRTPAPAPAAVTGMTRDHAFRAQLWNPAATSNPGDLHGGVLSARTANMTDAAAGVPWSVTLQGRVDQPCGFLGFAVTFYDRLGNYLDRAITYVAYPAGGVAVTRVLVAVAPDGTACVDAGLFLFGLPAQTPVTVDVTAVRLDQVRDDDLPYLDGDSPGWSWSGARGQSVSQLETTALAEDQDVVTVLSPYRADSPLTTRARPVLETAIEVETGFLTDEGERTTRLFSGHLTKLGAGSADRTLQLEALDPADRLRAVITLPGVGLDALLYYKYGPEVYRSNMNSQWAVSEVLRRNDIFASPPFRDDAVLAVTCHGSMVPSVGWGGTPEEFFLSYRGQMWDSDGPFNMIWPNVTGGARRGRWRLETPITAAPGTGIGVSMWVGLGGSNPSTTSNLIELPLTADATVRFLFGIADDGRPYLGMFINGAVYGSAPSNWFPGATRTPTFVGAHVSFGNSGMTVTWRVGATQTSLAGVRDSSQVVAPIPERSVSWAPAQYATYALFRQTALIQLWPAAKPPSTWLGETWTPQADIDPGGNILTGIPEINAVPSLDVLKDITAAEFARFGYNPLLRRFQWRSRYGDELRGRAPVVEEIDADRNLSDLVTTIDESMVRNVVTVTSVARFVGKWTDAFTADALEQFDSAPGTTVFEVDLPGSVCELPGPGDSAAGSMDQNRPFAPFIYYSTQDNWDKLAKTDGHRERIRMMMVRRDFPDQVVTTDVDVRVFPISPWKFFFVVFNRRADHVRFATPTVRNNDNSTTAGQPALIIPARRLEEQPADVNVASDPGSIAVYGERSLDIGDDNPWRQLWSGMVGITSGVLAQTAHPTPVFDAFDVAHDPRRELNNQVRVCDPDGLGSVRASIVDLASTVSAAGARDRVVVRPIAPPGLGLLDDTELGLVDQSLVLAP